jgi:acetolactate synthase I/II/III large subunit
MKRLVADEIANALVESDVNRLFLLTGGDQALWIAPREAGVQMALARSEQGATYMADGYARAAGNPALTYGQHGPGAANVAAAIADAFWAGSPVVALTSSVPTAARSGFPYQALDQQALFAPVTKWQREITAPAAAGALIQSAIRMAAAAPSGPVHVDIPRDVIRAPASPALAAPTNVASVTPVLDPDPKSIEAALAHLLSAERPLILAGSGLIQSGGWRELRVLAERLRTPVATTVGGKGAIPEDHPLALGVTGRYSRKVANEVMAEADVVLVLGSRLGSLATADGTLPSPASQIIQVDIDPAVLSVIRPDAMAVQGDARRTLMALTEAVSGSALSRNQTWPIEVQRRVAAWREHVAERLARHTGAAIHPGRVLASLRTVLGSDAIVVADTGYMAAWAAALFPIHQAGRNFLRAAGSLGWALPAAVGASLAAGNRRVACVTGDGGVAYNMMELETAARLGIPLLVVVLNNRSLAFEYHDQKHHWEGQVVPEVNDLTDIDYGALARDLGARGRRLTDPAELETAMQQALASGDPFLLDVIVDKEVIAPVTNFDQASPRTI